MNEIIDISRPFSGQLAEWPGDTPFQFELKWRMAEGATVNVGAVNMGLHNGTHADATFHFQKNGTTMERMPLEPYLGPAIVIDLGEARREITVPEIAAHEEAITRTRRLLLKTNGWRDSSVFPDWIPVLAADVPAWLGERKLLLLGVDVPSVDAIDSKDLRNHHALAGAQIAIVEGLDLTNAFAGEYQLSALPLKIGGGDGASVRAVLWRDQE